MTQSVYVSPEWLREVATSMFSAAGLEATAAEQVAQSLVIADMRGVSSHGSMLVPMYVDRLLEGSVSTRVEADVVVDHGGIAVLDAHHMLGQLSGDQAMALAVRKAHSHGVGAVVVRHAFHFGGASRYVEFAASRGCIGIAAANTRPLMPAPGGASAVVGNNPVAVGVPLAGSAPIILDMAMSEAALGKIRLAAQEGREIPATWATDSHGTPTVDPSAAIAGLLLPMAGHKGYGLALAVDVLTGVLSGGGFGSAVQGLYADTTVPNNCAHFFLALDTAAFGDQDGFRERASRLTAEVLSSPTAPGVERTLLPGQLESERQAEAERRGVRLDASVLEALQRTATKLGIDLAEPVVVAAGGTR